MGSDSVGSGVAEHGAVIHRILAGAGKGALATLMPVAGGVVPFASLVAIAARSDGRVVMLLSALAQHSRNLAERSPASLLVEGGDTQGMDPTAGSRVSIVGVVETSVDEADRALYLARHPSAAGYAGFADFSVRVLVPDTFHLVAGFGRIATLRASDVRGGASQSPAVEPD